MNLILQLRSNLPKIALALIISALFIGLVVLLNVWKDIPVGLLTRDPNAIAHTHFYIGFFSQIGVFLWSATAAICFFSAKVIRRSQESITAKRFLFFGGLLTLILGLDDIFQFHENTELYFGIPEKIVFFAYGSYALSFMVYFCKEILKTSYIVFIMALSFFGLSMIIDRYYYRLPDALDLYLFEDGAKMVGIVSWFIYFSHSAVTAVSKHVTQQAASPHDHPKNTA